MFRNKRLRPKTLAWWQTWPDRLARWSFLIIFSTLAVSLLLGLVAALLGGVFTRLGFGPGGVWGAPDLILGLAMVLALPSFVLGFVGLFRHQSGSWQRMLAYLFPLMMWLGYFFIAHTLDPCWRGILNSSSQLGSVALCERFGTELNLHTRFHLLWHVIPTLPLLLLYGWLSLRDGALSQAS